MTDQLSGRNGHVFIVSAARTPIGTVSGRNGHATLCLGGGGSVAAAFERSER
jgi:acetyl-CoA acetyltransferase